MDTLQDNVILSGLFDKAMSPVNTLGQGLVEKALMLRREAEKQNELELQLRYQAARDAAHEAHTEKLVELNSNARAKEREQEFKLLSDAKREELRKDTIAKVQARTGMKMSGDTSYEVASQELAKSYGREKIAAAKGVAQVLGEYAALRNQTIQDVTSKATSEAVAALSTKETKAAGLTMTDLNRLLTEPGAMLELRAKARRDKNEEAFALLNKINANINTSITTGMESAEKSKPELANMADRFKVAQKNWEEIAHQGGSDEASGMESTAALFKDLGKGPAQPTGPPRSNLTGQSSQGGLTPGSPAPSGPPGQYPGLIPMAVSAVGSGAASAFNKYLAPPLGYAADSAALLKNKLFGGTLFDPSLSFTRDTPAAFDTTAPNPALKAYLDSQAASQNLNLKTAFPINTNTSALPFGYQPP